MSTVTFECPRCLYRQKGYFAVCPVPGCDAAKWREFVAEMRAIMEANQGERVTAGGQG
ncbi:MAG: hypothetical protein ACJ74Q_15190 [Pyrinomonadaceae bacterium]